MAFPEWSSHCVVSAIGAYCTPIPITEVIRYGIPVDSVLIYEQWGWPVRLEVMQQLAEYFKGTIFVKDMVDSAHVMRTMDAIPDDFKAFVEIISLSKLLGLLSGGIAKVNGEYLSFCPETESKMLLNVFEDRGVIEQPGDLVKNILKEDIKALPAQLAEWTAGNDLFGAVEHELMQRQKNLKDMLNTMFAEQWPDWMKEAIENGAGPGIVPLLRGCSQDSMLKNRERLLRLHGYETCVYHFNWSGNPVEPQYEKCLAFPVHGMVSGIEEILKTIVVDS
ncbi:MAG: hypothetical protein HQL08_06345 [Nitrospirae bacterium]|nr:hypothetical protein [Nitrospirota bacterium]